MDFGGEVVSNNRLEDADIALPDHDMLVGMDFFLSHRILVANGQQRLYFTYNGGPVFNLDATDEDIASAAPAGQPRPAPDPCVQQLADHQAARRE